MTFPLDVHIGSLSVHFHLITDILSSLIGGWLYWRAAKGDNIPTSKREYLLIGAGIGALIGSRLIGSLENPALFLNPPTLLYYYASKTIIGGVAGGILGIEATKYIIGHKQSTGDRMAVPLFVAIIIGRIGCLFTGIIDGTVGNPCSLRRCFDQGDGIPRHPTSLYEIIFLIILLFVLNKYKKNFQPSGVMFRVSIIAYFGFRFLIEMIKPSLPLVSTFSVIQIVCILYIAWYSYDIYKLRKTYGKY
ncbi:MAG: hypothetical protein RL641_513 [Candidatus Parcubacteria bacterium]|jgi:prolipoprotein diacylglyceryltransferase